MITRFVVQHREPFAGGHEFPVTGAYEKLTGIIHGEVDPRNRRNRMIVNLNKAPRNRRGRVEYSSNFCVLKPLDLARGNGKIFFDAPNRGSKRILGFLNDAPQANDPTTLADAGNGFLMRQGYTIVWCGWQGDLMPIKNWLLANVPVATNNGKPIISRVRTEIVVDEPGIKSQPLSGDNRVKSYEAASLDKSQATLTVREKSYGQRVPVASFDWEYAACEKDILKPSSTDLYLRNGFKPGHIYEFIYPAKNPLVLGLGFAVVRDLVSFLRYGSKDRAGNSNPFTSANDGLKFTRSQVAGFPLLFSPRDGGRYRGGLKFTGVTHAYAWGRSQSGRYLRDFVYHGFNEDEAGRKVFDAIAPHVAGGGRLFFNYEFARPVTSSQQHTNQLDPELFPHAYNVINDAHTGRRDGILKRPKTDPCVFHTQTSTEYWQKRGCLAHTDGKGNDLKLPDNVRLYVIASAQHNSPFGSEPAKDDSQFLVNPLPAGDILRALMIALDEWASKGIAPPPSRYPMVKDGTLIAPSKKSFPKIPGVCYKALHNRQLFLDYGREILHGKMTIHPPKPIDKGVYKILVPKVDKDGNDIPGIRLPAIQVPIGTYTGWNLRPQGLAEGDLAGLLGSYIAFANTKAERQKSGDSRLSIEERYKDQSDCVQQISRAARRLVEEGFLLREDAERIIAEATKTNLCTDRIQSTESEKQ
jgi:hypothetical protein